MFKLVSFKLLLALNLLFQITKSSMLLQLILACLLAFALADPKPLTTFYSGLGSTYTAYSNYAPYAGGYYGYGYGALPYNGFYY